MLYCYSTLMMFGVHSLCSVYLGVFGHPVAQHIQDPVGGSPPDDKLLVPIPLVCRKACGQDKKHDINQRPCTGAI